MQRDLSIALSQTIRMPDGIVSDLLSVALELCELAELGRGGAGEEGRVAFDCLFRHCSGESIEPKKLEALKQWHLIDSDDRVDPLKRSVLLSSFRRIDGGFCIEPPFSTEGESKGAVLAIRIAQEYAHRLLPYQLQAQNEGSTVPEAVSQHILREAIDHIESAPPMSPETWISRLDFERQQDEHKKLRE